VYSLTTCSWYLPPRRRLHLHQCDPIPNACLQVLPQHRSNSTNHEQRSCRFRIPRRLVDRSPPSSRDGLERRWESLSSRSISWLVSSSSLPCPSFLYSSCIFGFLHKIANMHLIQSLIALVATFSLALADTTDFCFGCHETPTPTPSETSFCFGCHETSTSTSAEPSFCFDADCQTPTYTPTSFSFSGPPPSQSQVPVKAEWTLEIFPESDRCNSEDESSVRSLLLPPLKLTRKYRSLTLLARVVHLELRILGVFRGRREITAFHQRVQAEV
jgi:hypothetical protein